MDEILTIKEASEWATNYLRKKVTTSNISYLIQYGVIKNVGQNGTPTIKKNDLVQYYNLRNGNRENKWREQLGDDLNWALSFDTLREKDTTKHIHRLHPYKGKFIPQLVEYFIDNHIDNFKKETYFQQGDIILDPFSGSGTTMVQANEQGMHAIGIDISAFNTLIANAKVGMYDLNNLYFEVSKISNALLRFISNNTNTKFENELTQQLNIYNNKHFPSPEYKIKIKEGKLKEQEYALRREEDFATVFETLLRKYQLKIKQDKSESFLEKWYLEPVINEINFVYEHLKAIDNPTTKKIVTIILSRTIRSCRATTHADLATLKEPITKTYYCKKHGKICKPLFSIRSWWERYSKDTIKRIAEFNKLRTNTYQQCLQGDARNIDIFNKLSEKNNILGKVAKKQKIKGIFSSPPYVGLIDYHEQHAYAYDLFGFQRNDELEIGPLFKGQGKEARNSYIEGIAQVLNNAKPYLQDDYDVFLVANDKYNMYPTIAEKSSMKIVNQYKRPVLNRTEKDKSAYAEIIFHLKEK